MLFWSYYNLKEDIIDIVLAPNVPDIMITDFIYNLVISFEAFVLLMLQVIEIQLPSFFNNFDPRAAAANFPSSNMFIILGVERDVRLVHINLNCVGIDDLIWHWRCMNLTYRCTSLFGGANICIGCLPLQYTCTGKLARICSCFKGSSVFLFYF